MAAHSQQLPDSVSQLSPYFQAPYFHTPVNDADTILARYEMLKGSADQANPAYQGASIIQDPKTLVDHIDNVVLIGPTKTSSAPPPGWPPSGFPDELMSVVKSYEDANYKSFLSIYDLKPYATTPEQKAALNEFIKEATITHH
jgi:hypothetical protein